MVSGQPRAVSANDLGGPGLRLAGPVANKQTPTILPISIMKSEEAQEQREEAHKEDG